MKKAEIEHLVSSKIRTAVENAVFDVINELKSAGHNYESLDDFLFEWAEPDSKDSLKINCSIAVDLSSRINELRQEDPNLQSFISLAESGEDHEASILNLLEGDVANGGFMQLYDNKGDKFIKESISLLRKIGSRYALQILEQALSLIYEERSTLEQYDKFQKKIDHLNRRFWNLQESIPEMFMQYRQKGGD